MFQPVTPHDQDDDTLLADIIGDAEAIAAHEGDAQPDVPADEESMTYPLPRPKTRGRSFWRDIRDTIIMVIAIYTLVNLLAPRYIVEGSSMEPNFHTGEWIIVNRLGYLLNEPERGDVVVLDFEEPQEDLIKRIIGMPGDTVEVRDNLVYINGEVLPEHYINAQPRYSKDPVTLAENEYYVLGDNRNNSRDSHSFGPVTEDHLIGQAWVIYWPPQNWGIVPNQDYGSEISLDLTPTPVPTATRTPDPNATDSPHSW